ncbi:MAG: hypothetical protein H6Q64_1038 [Firmicutes bacterium]|nr:hypothetical protein [Bacillota bacterium]
MTTTHDVYLPLCGTKYKRQGLVFQADYGLNIRGMREMACLPPKTGPDIELGLGYNQGSY